MEFPLHSATPAQLGVGKQNLTLLGVILLLHFHDDFRECTGSFLQSSASFHSGSGPPSSPMGKTLHKKLKKHLSPG